MHLSRLPARHEKYRPEPRERALQTRYPSSNRSWGCQDYIVVTRSKKTSKRKPRAAASGQSPRVGESAQIGTVSSNSKNATASNSGEAEANAGTSLQIVVLGMHRSGTSALTGALARMGVHVGDEDELTARNWENPQGFFERRDARTICDALLHGSGADWWKVSAFEPENVDFDTLRAQRPAIRDLVAGLDQRAKGAWVLKEPRLCLLMPIFRSTLTNPFAIVVVRHPMEVARSLRRRNGFPIQAGLALWEAYTVAALDNASGVDHTVVSYDELVEKPQKTLKRLCQELAGRGLEWVDSNAGQKGIQPSLRRERVEEAALARLTPEQRKLWRLLEQRDLPTKPPKLSRRALEVLREFEADQAGRERIMAENRTLERALKKANATVEEQSRTLSQRKSELESARSDLSEREAELAEARTEAEKLATRLESAEGRKAELSSDLEQAQSRLEEHSRMLAEKTSELESARSELSAQSRRDKKRIRELDAANADLAREIQSLDKELHVRQVEVSRATQSEKRLSDEVRAQRLLIKRQQERINLFEILIRRLSASRVLRLSNRLQALPLNPFTWPRQLALHRRARRIAASGLFAPAWYLKKYPDVCLGPQTPIMHYLNHGAKEGRSPHPAFDPVWYTAQLKSERIESTTPVEHYLDADREDRVSPHQLFDEKWYLDNNRDVANDGGPPLSHFLLFGGFEARDPNPDFNSALYLEQNPDIAEKHIDPLSHFLMSEVAQVPDPDPEPGSPASDRNISDPATRKGKQKVTKSGPSQKTAESGDLPVKDQKLSDPIAAKNPPSVNSNAGSAELIQKSGLFDPEWYKRRYPDIAQKGADPLTHYLKRGAREGRDPSPMFSTAWYVKKYLGNVAECPNPLVHYIETGQSKGYKRIPTPGRQLWWDKVRSTPWMANPDAPAPSLKNVKQTIELIVGNCKSVCIVIPVFNAPDELRACLQSVVENTQNCDQIIAINDASSDRRVESILEHFKNKYAVEVFCNDKNLGFTGTVNRGFELAGRSDVLLLNADTIVTSGWLERLQLAAYSEARVGTATPVSNNAGAFSVPLAGKKNDIPNVGLEVFARAIAQTSLFRYPKTPTGNGFCMYIRRDCLDEAGLFDAEAFPVGYGEENDFCMRAGSNGWAHVVDDSTYIYHVRSASFGEEQKQGLLKAGREVIDARYPNYGSAARAFVNSDDMVEVRSNVSRVAHAISAADAQVKPRVLYVIPALSAQGGTPQTNQDLMQAIGDRVETFLLRSNSASLELFSFRDGEYVPLEYARLDSPLSAFPHRSEQYDEIFSEWLVKYQFDLVHVRHIAFHSLGLIHMAKALSIPVIFSFHDFYTICPTVKLLDENRTFCGGVCTQTPGDCQPDLWADAEFPRLKNAAVLDWRKMLESTLGVCDCLVTTADSAKSLVLKNFPGLKDKPFAVIPHGRDFSCFADDTVPSIQDDEPIRILVPGSIGFAKGAGVLTELAAAASDQNIEIHVLGRITEGGPIPGVVEHGAYTRDDFVARVMEIRPHLGAVLSIWPETFCHTLTEQWAAGVPVVGFDFGAVAERIRGSGAGWILKETTADAVLGLIENIRKDPKCHDRAVRNVIRWQKKVGLVQTTSWMANRYQEIYESANPAMALNGKSTLTSGNVSSSRFHSFESPAASCDMSDEIGSVSIIVPVHNAFDDCRKCLRSLISHTFPPVELVVVDDGSGDDTKAWLETFAESNPHVILCRHSTPLGYTHAVNKGVKLSRGEILVILNSDTIVPPFWLERLVEPLLQDANTVAAGPISNAATWQSIPEIRDEDGGWATNQLPNGVEVADFDRWVQSRATDLPPEAVELLNGFCYAIRAKAFREMRGLDSKAFPSGYGEETDLFLKLADRQYRAVVVPNLYIFHAKSKSFGKDRRQRLAAQGNEVLYRRYGKERIVTAAATLKDSKTLAALRGRCKEFEMRELELLKEPFRILFLMPVAGMGGGVHSIVQEAEGLSARGHDVSVLITEKHGPLFKQSYPSQYADGLFETFSSDVSLVEKARVRDVIIATHFLSIRLLKSARNQYPDKLFMYYVQDYEPWIVPKGSPLYQAALESYTGLEGAVLMAKTRWICRMVHNNHCVRVHKIAPSIDHSIYRVDPATERLQPALPITVAAMVRPTTSRRAPEATISVLRAIRNQMGSDVNIEVFGCTDDELFCIPGADECQLENHGVLLREGVSSVLNRADLFIDMSSYQAFGRTALEAMACGTLAAVPRFGGGSEYSWADQAVLSLPTDDTSASIGLILGLLKDQERMQSMRKRGLAVACQFSIDKAATSIEDLILRCREAVAETESPAWRQQLQLKNDPDKIQAHANVKSQSRHNGTA